MMSTPLKLRPTQLYTSNASSLRDQLHDIAQKRKFVLFTDIDETLVTTKAEFCFGSRICDSFVGGLHKLIGNHNVNAVERQMEIEYYKQGLRVVDYSYNELIKKCVRVSDECWLGGACSSSAIREKSERMDEIEALIAQQCYAVIGLTSRSKEGLIDTPMSDLQTLTQRMQQLGIDFSDVQQYLGSNSQTTLTQAFQGKVNVNYTSIGTVITVEQQDKGKVLNCLLDDTLSMAARMSKQTSDQDYPAIVLIDNSPQKLEDSYNLLNSAQIELYDTQIDVYLIQFGAIGRLDQGFSVDAMSSKLRQICDALELELDESALKEYQSQIIKQLSLLTV